MQKERSAFQRMLTEYDAGRKVAKTGFGVGGSRTSADEKSEMVPQ
jgi:hypothetical protein